MMCNASMKPKQMCKDMGSLWGPKRIACQHVVGLGMGFGSVLLYAVVCLGGVQTNLSAGSGRGDG